MARLKVVLIYLATLCAFTAYGQDFVRWSGKYSVVAPPDSAAPAFTPYSFTIDGLTDPFAIEFFHLWKKKKIRIFRDSARTTRYKYADFKNEVFFIDYLLSNRFLKKKILPRNMEAYPRYDVDLFIYENWEVGQTPQPQIVRREKTLVCLTVKDANKTDFPSVKLFFSPYEKNVPYKKLNRSIDYNGYEEVTSEEVFENAFYNVSFIDKKDAVPARLHADDANERLKNVQLSSPTLSEYAINIPVKLKKDNYLSETLPESRLDLVNNAKIFQQLITPLFRAVLTGKITAYDFGTQEKVTPVSFIYDRIETHPKTPGAIDARALQNWDFSFGVESCEAIGKMRLNGGKANFIPSYLSITWTDESAPVPQVSLGKIYLKDIDKAGFLIDGKKVSTFLSELNYYYYPFRINSAYPNDVLEAYYINALITQGDWNKLEPQRAVHKKTPNEKKALIKEIYKLP